MDIDGRGSERNRLHSVNKKVTISEVAARARVSKATVSRVLNRPQIVAVDAQERVHRAMAELSYQPNRHARALGGIHRKTVGLLFFKDLWDLVLNPFWGMATSTVYERLLDNDMDCNLIALGESITAKERFSTGERYAQFLGSRNVDGFLVIGHMSPEYEEYFASGEVPAVLWGRPAITGSKLLYADSNHEGGAVLGVTHLIERGRRNIATITGDMTTAPARDRYDGYVRALREHSLDLRWSWIAEGDFTRSSGAEAMRSLLDSGAEVDGLFAANDEMALGAMDVLAARGLSVPGDVSVVGFDNVTLPQRGGPRLTSVSHSYDDLGAELVDGLAARMRGEAYTSRLVATQLVVGDTT